MMNAIHARASGIIEIISLFYDEPAVATKLGQSPDYGRLWIITERKDVHYNRCMHLLLPKKAGYAIAMA